MRGSARSLRLAALVLLTVWASSLGTQPVGAAPGASHIAFVSGLADIAGRSALVDIAVMVREGEDELDVGRAALEQARARPITAADPDFVLDGLRWPQFFDADTTNDFVVQQYNPAGDATADPIDAEAAVTNAEATWTAVPTSPFAYEYGGPTATLPGFDEINVAAWQSDWQFDPSALAITISFYEVATGFLLDSDVFLNSENWQWSAEPDGPSASEADLESILLHEDGHAFGLGHSTDPTAVMYAYYDLGTVHRSLAPDDVDAISTLYPAESSSCTTHCLRSTAIVVKGKRIPGGAKVSAGIQVQDEHGRFVSNATVTMEWSLPNGTMSPATATTNRNGVATFTVFDGRGTYVATVTAIKRAGSTFDPEHSVVTASTTV